MAEAQDESAPADAQRRSPDATAAGLAPGSFAFVMATGIMAVAAKLQHLDLLARTLYVPAAVGHVVLIVLLLRRITAHRRRFLDDLLAHSRGFAFLTIVAGTNVLAAGAIVVLDRWTVARVLWWVGVVLWPTLTYTTLISVVIRTDKPGLAAGINGSWFLLTVSVQSVAVVAGLLIGRDQGDLLAFTALCAFGLGFVLYLIVMTMVFLRWSFDPLDPTEADPPAWIAAGAVAITVLAGSNLLLAARGGSVRLQHTTGFLESIVILSWATSTFWFPLMVAIGVWRHVVRRLPLRYTTAYWSMVFPIGMYSVATRRMLQALEISALGWLPDLVFVVAMVAWSATAIGMVHSWLTPRTGTGAPSKNNSSTH